MDLDDGPPPGNPGDLSHFGHFDSNQIATQANYPHDSDGNMDCEETGLETVDFGTYAATLTASNTEAGINADNNTLEMMLQKTTLPEDQIRAILVANKSETTGKQNRKMPRNGKNEMQQNANDMHDGNDDKKLKIAKMTPLKKTNPKGKTLASNSYTIAKRDP